MEQFAQVYVCNPQNHFLGAEKPHSLLFHLLLLASVVVISKYANFYVKTIKYRFAKLRESLMLVCT